MNRAYYVSLFSAFLVALAAFAIARAAPSSSLLSVVLALGAFWATFLLALVLTQRHERVWLRSSLRVRRLVQKLKQNIRLGHPRRGFNQTSYTAIQPLSALGS